SASIASVFGIVFSLYVIFGEKYTLSISGSSFLNFAFVADRLSAFFILSMIFVVTASNAVMFLIVWELMSVISYFLVIYEHEKPETRKAGFIYIVMTHIGTGFIILSFLILTDGSGSFNFDSMSGVSLPPLLKDLVFIFALIGFGTKAGIVPLHIWLPYAHPAAPSNVSALMSG
ncbi:MAG: hydrogenase 4 subunit B, partial [Euryarchaeota archaeon]|nr:hydrogenase 4 subunit B [Euryarchaeota archaeon]MBU4454724.1 hydrogenase 4 subunit B [Euryarchaeota archaeon]